MDLHPKHTQVEKYVGVNGLGSGFGSRLRTSGVSQPFISVSFAVLSYAAGPGRAEAERKGFALELSQLGAEQCPGRFRMCSNG